MHNDKKYEKVAQLLSIQLSSLSDNEREDFYRLLAKIESDTSIISRQFELRCFPNLAA